MIKKNTPTDDELLRKQQFFKLVGQANGHLQQQASAMSEIKYVYKRASLFRLTKKHFKYAKMFQDPELEDDFMGELEVMKEVADWMGAKPARQMSFFTKDRTPLVDIAYQHGYRAGVMGEAMNNPHDLSTEAGQKWQEGLNDGNSFRNQEFREALERAEHEKEERDDTSAEPAQEGNMPESDQPFQE